MPLFAAMTATAHDVWLAGVDGCPAGWIAAFVRPAGGDVSIAVLPRFADVLAEARGIVAVDMPIGLPERVGSGGRAAENAVRPLLGARQSSVFSVPSRAAICADDYAASCTAALGTSDPPRKVSKQLFNIAPKIREVDAVLRADTALVARVFEVHPELAFWRLNGERALDRTEEGEEPLPRAGPGAAARAPDRRGACRRRSSRRSRRRAPGRTISSTRSPAPPSRGGSAPVARDRFPTRRRAMLTDCQWRSGREVLPSLRLREREESTGCHRRRCVTNRWQRGVAR